MALKEYVKSKEEVRVVSKIRREYIKEYVDFLIKEGSITKEKVVVDIPCGTGDVADAILRKVNVNRLVLIDINKNMVDSAKERLGNKVSAIIGAAEEIENLIGFKVDTILCLNGFHQYIDDKQKFLEGCKKILGKNGRLVFDISTRGLTDKYTRKFFGFQRKFVNEISKKYGVKSQLPLWPDAGLLNYYRNMIAGNGLKLINEKEFKTFKSVRQVLSGAVAVPGRSRPWFPGLSYEKRKNILAKATEKAVEKLGEREIECNRIFFVYKN